MAKEKVCCALCGESCEETNKEKKRNMKNDKKETVKIRFCPNCGNTDVRYVFKLRNVFGVLPRMECAKCGYHNSTFPLIEVEKGKIKEIEKLITKKRRKNKNA